MEEIYEKTGARVDKTKDASTDRVMRFLQKFDDHIERNAELQMMTYAKMEEMTENMTQIEEFDESGAMELARRKIKAAVAALAELETYRELLGADIKHQTDENDAVAERARKIRKRGAEMLKITQGHAEFITNIERDTQILRDEFEKHVLNGKQAAEERGKILLAKVNKHFQAVNKVRARNLDVIDQQTMQAVYQKAKDKEFRKAILEAMPIEMGEILKANMRALKLEAREAAERGAGCAHKKKRNQSPKNSPTIPENGNANAGGETAKGEKGESATGKGDKGTTKASAKEATTNVMYVNLFRRKKMRTYRKKMRTSYRGTHRRITYTSLICRRDIA